MKIAYVNTFYAPDEIGGAEKSVRFLAEAMVSNGHQATVITLGRQRASDALSGVQIERLPSANLYFPADSHAQSSLRKLAWHTIDSYNPRVVQTIGEVLDQCRPDVVHTNNLSGFSVAAWSAIKRRGIPVVHTLRDYYLLCPNTAMFKNGAACERRCAQCKVLSIPREHASQDIDCVVGNSQFILDKHTQFGLFKQANKQVIYNAYQPKDISSTRPAHTIQFGFIGRLSPTKGVEVLIEATRQLASQFPAHFQIVIAGEGDPGYVEQLQKKSAGLPIQFLGRTSPEHFYNQVHWTVLPSLWDEPLARVLFESFAHGVPVIGSATGGTPELLINDQTGWIYSDPFNATNLAQRMKQALVVDDDRAMRQACITVAKNFTPDQVYSNYLNVYQTLSNKG